jgi:hypothetical protein
MKKTTPTAAATDADDSVGEVLCNEESRPQWLPVEEGIEEETRWGEKRCRVIVKNLTAA